MMGFGNNLVECYSIIFATCLPILSVKRENVLDMNTVLFVPSPRLGSGFAADGMFRYRKIYWLIMVVCYVLHHRFLQLGSTVPLMQEHKDTFGTHCWTGTLWTKVIEDEVRCYPITFYATEVTKDQCTRFSFLWGSEEDVKRRVLCQRCIGEESRELPDGGAFLDDLFLRKFPVLIGLSETDVQGTREGIT